MAMMYDWSGTEGHSLSLSSPLVSPPQSQVSLLTVGPKEDIENVTL